MTHFRRSSPLEQLPALLPALLADVSLGRSQLIVDQLRGALERGGADQIVIVALPREADSSGSSAASADAEPAALALAIAQPPSDAATLLHAGWIAQPAGAGRRRRMGQQLRRQLHRELARRGVRFLQWATDPLSEADTAPSPPSGTSAPQADETQRASPEQLSTAQWAERLGLEPVATLRYLTGRLAELSQRLPNDRPPEPRGVQLVPVDRDDPASFDRFAGLVQRTYHETLDCQPLSRMRSAEQILAAYHHSRAFQDQWWYRVNEADDASAAGDRSGASAAGEAKATDRAAIGCLILAAHRAEGDSEAPEPPTAGSVAELVYMGVVPEARGRGLGRQLVTETVRRVRRWGAERLILAVDERNRPAKDAYAAAGLAPLLRETVWAASLPPRGR